MALMRIEGQGFAAAVFYGVCSASMAFLNKGVINSYEFPFPFFIMACQMLVTVVFLEILITLGKISLPAYTWRSAYMFLAPSLGYAFHATLSLMALQGMNIPMYGAVKRLLGDLTFDTFAYTMGGFSVLAQGLYLTLVQQCAENKLSTWEILQLNSYNTLGPFIISSVLMGEPEAIVQNRYITDAGFHFTFWTLVCMGAVLNYSLFLCTALNSALTTSLVSVAKSAIQTLVGFFVFGGVKYHPLNIAGIVMNTVGGFMYTYTKFQEGKKNTFQKDENYNKVSINSNLSFPAEKSLHASGVTKDLHALSEIKVS
ncbi:UDP-galactose/UDP-glucose transporter 7-like 2 [Homarus americanus]|uniref:UDP-galactose/UDP-glucose transporter 7-like 2 n=1 Tax=Homarus americanus TaxID=6706 RepID=A0A8J5MX95_HOMAM|nr:UDP-galactose/UDP-glucose transporter 7-like 2 [Homarus americanus]